MLLHTHADSGHGAARCCIPLSLVWVPTSLNNQPLFGFEEACSTLWEPKRSVPIGEEATVAEAGRSTVEPLAQALA